MKHKIIIRSERGTDVDAITEVTVAAFKTLEISNHTEQFIIAALRAAKALTVSLVAESDGRVVGHVAFSPAFDAYRGGDAKDDGATVRRSGEGLGMNVEDGVVRTNHTLGVGTR